MKQPRGGNVQISKTNKQRQQIEGRNIIRKSRNRHRERLAKREESYRNETKLLKQQASGLPNQRQIKLNNINMICKTLDLMIVKMAADGHCLFSAGYGEWQVSGLMLAQSEDWRATVNGLVGTRTPFDDEYDGGAAEDRARICELFDGLWKPEGQG
ncbi:hypothetical protein BY996DRAFT_6465846 [Phakopsora pachyrhizi]|nr:hypothetical protein BY996DRAFT_6465846 [Phakopsora pachyrhizi]